MGPAESILWLTVHCGGAWIVGLLVLGTSGSLGHDVPAAAPLKTQTVKSTVDPHGKPGKLPPAPDFGLPQVALINGQIRQGWQDHQFSPSPAATDGEWCRRLFLDVLGRVPSISELTNFLNSKSTNRKVELVNSLLGEDYADDYARNWMTIWTNLLIGRTGGTDRRSADQPPGFAIRRCGGHFKTTYPTTGWFPSWSRLRE